MLVTAVEKSDNARTPQVKGRSVRSPRCIVIAGPNGAGKTTFAREFLPREAGVIHFVNADLIASGLSPLKPELAARQRGAPGADGVESIGSGAKELCF